MTKPKNKMTKQNKKYKAVGDWDYKELPVSQKELERARKKAIELLKKDPTNMAWRSCWICNHAHIHFLEGEWGDWVLNCFECGKFFYDKIDITDYGEQNEKTK